MVHRLHTQGKCLRCFILSHAIVTSASPYDSFTEECPTYNPIFYMLSLTSDLLLGSSATIQLTWLTSAMSHNTCFIKLN